MGVCLLFTISRTSRIRDMKNAPVTIQWLQKSSPWSPSAPLGHPRPPHRAAPSRASPCSHSVLHSTCGVGGRLGDRLATTNIDFDRKNQRRRFETHKSHKVEHCAPFFVSATIMTVKVDAEPRGAQAQQSAPLKEHSLDATFECGIRGICSERAHTYRLTGNLDGMECTFLKHRGNSS